MPRRILIVEDHIKTAESIKKGLSEQDMIVDIALNGKIAKDKIIKCQYDLIISDIIMPELNGIELCTYLRNQKINTPILLLSALDSTDMKITGLDAGGDDYLTKPFEFKELLARARALYRRNKEIEIEIEDRTIIAVGDLTINIRYKSVERKGIKIDLTPKEYKLLEYLILKKGQVVNKTELVENVWEFDFDPGTNVVEVYINYLRNKIDKGHGQKLIHNRSGIGYFISEI